MRYIITEISNGYFIKPEINGNHTDDKYGQYEKNLKCVGRTCVEIKKRLEERK